MNTSGFFQRLGRALQLPIAVLPMVTLLLRPGQPDLPNAALIAQVGSVIFDNLALIFAIGVVSNWSKDSASTAALAGTVGYFVLTKAMATISPEINIGVPAGTTTGLVGSAAHNRWSDIKLPDLLNFFGGKRLVPIATGFFCLVLAAIFDYVWLPVQHIIHAGDEWIAFTGTPGSGISGFINRLLIPTGLHQVLSIIAWFQIGEFTNAAGTVPHSDINRFYVGDGTAGMFMSGFFPIMMLGLLGTASAMYFATPKEHRSMVDGMLLSVTVTAFLIGVTEPLEFLFMLLAPLLYLLHALLIGISLFVTMSLGTHAGFSSSAGAIDHALMYNLPAASQNIWILLMMGVVFFVVCFVVFSLTICMFNLKTSGCEDKEDEIVTEGASSNAEEGLNRPVTNYITAVGGTDNLKAIDARITRLRLTVADSAHVNDTMYKHLSTSGVAKLNKQTIQVIVGAKVESIGDAMKKVITRGSVAATSAETIPITATPVAEPQAVPNTVSIAELVSPVTGDVVALGWVPGEAFVSRAVGDGVAVKSTDKIVVSSAAGIIAKIFNTNHVFCLETEKGAEIAAHMGTDTVALEGEGFRCLVEEGVQVSAG